MSMRMCSLSRSVHDAHRRNTALNNTHCSSSQEFDDMSNTLRTVALTADTATAARIAHATHLPICVLMASITPLSLRSARTSVPVPLSAQPQRASWRMAPPHRRRCPGGRYGDHLSKDNERKVKSPLTKNRRTLLKNWSGRRESNPRHTAWEAVVLPLNYARTATVFRHSTDGIPTKTGTDVPLYHRG